MLSYIILRTYICNGTVDNITQWSHYSLMYYLSLTCYTSPIATPFSSPFSSLVWPNPLAMQACNVSAQSAGLILQVIMPCVEGVWPIPSSYFLMTIS